MTKHPDPQVQSMIDNMPEKTGRSLEDWYRVLKASKLDKHAELMNVLKGDHGVSHGYANMIVLLYRQSKEGAPAEADMVAAQFSGPKAGLRPIYDAVLTAVDKFGRDVEVAPKKAYVSLRRSKQFAIVQASTKTRVDLGLNLQGVEATDRLEGGVVFSGMCTHKVKLTSAAEVDKQVVGWLKQAYDQA
jgi:predicted transport protein